eukprot:gene13463-19324_t
MSSLDPSTFFVNPRRNEMEDTARSAVTMDTSEVHIDGPIDGKIYCLGRRDKYSQEERRWATIREYMQYSEGYLEVHLDDSGAMDIETRVNELIAEGHAEHSARVIAELESMNRATIDVAVHAVRAAFTELGDDWYVDDRQLQQRRGRLHDCLSTLLTWNIGSLQVDWSDHRCVRYHSRTRVLEVVHNCEGA